MEKPQTLSFGVSEQKAARTALSVNNDAVPLNSFTKNYIAHILFGLVHSLGHNPKEVILIIDDGILSIDTETGPVEIKKDFARQLIQNTVKGMLSPLKGVLWLENITISSRRG